MGKGTTAATSKAPESSVPEVVRRPTAREQIRRVAVGAMPPLAWRAFVTARTGAVAPAGALPPRP